MWRTEDHRKDVLTAVVTFALGWLLHQVGLVDLVDGPDPLGTVDPEPWWHLLLLAAGCSLLLVKRSRPMLALGAGLLLMGVDLWWGGSLAMMLVLWDLLYAAALWSSPTARAWLWGSAVAVTVVTSVAAGEASRDVRSFVFTGLQLGAVLLVPLWWATNVRQKSELAELERERADLAALAAATAAREVGLERARAADLERLGELDRQEAVQMERAAMARDLHDVIASHLSAIAIHSGAALAAPPTAARDRAALEQVRTSAVASLEEMRSMILLLRTDARRDERADPVAAPGRIGRIDAVLDAARATGAQVHLDDSDGVTTAALPAAADQALHRITQEALTNAVKHAPGAAVAVRLRHEGAPDGPGTGGEGGRIVLVVRNDAPGVHDPLVDPSLSARTGMLTMRERAEGLGGTLEAGAAPDGGWCVRATIPVPARLGTATDTVTEKAP
ncbi:sensor histidine kinase [Oerskovia flava]|uniref:sensor histidine kinase n=1 Tax=Oerskovia flava TaxID=2986422 RepID=UPI0022408FA7|nr:histidine kinase [Oerskovia sp. JB1-3-2]